MKSIDKTSAIAPRLKQVRKSKGYSQTTLAEAIGVSRGVISNLEYGKTINEPQPLVTRAICEVLQINESWLLYGEGDESNNSSDSSRLLTEIHKAAAELSPEEQDFILDLIKTFSKHRETIRNVKKEQSK